MLFPCCYLHQKVGISIYISITNIINLLHNHQYIKSASLRTKPELPWIPAATELLESTKQAQNKPCGSPREWNVECSKRSGKYIKLGKRDITATGF
jgi:hypothetical protein